MPEPKRILICPLEWGLGHATRCIPIINALLEKKAEVIIAADGQVYELLKKEFPQLELIRLRGYAVTYPVKGSMMLKMLVSIPSIFRGIRRERRQLQNIIADKKIDIVISDNRFGCYGKTTKNIFITHQLMIRSPFFERTLKKINWFYINKYHECWIPDHKGRENLAGYLSQREPLPENARYIGPLSRFSQTPASLTGDGYEILAIVSGPEPQRSQFESILAEELYKSGMNALMVLGIPSADKKEKKDNLTMVSHLPLQEMQTAIQYSKLVLARSGYSTIMDLAVLGKKAILIPTPGQTEQEYLAELMMHKNIAYSVPQKKFNLSNALKNSENYTGFSGTRTGEGLNERIANLLD